MKIRRTSKCKGYTCAVALIGSCVFAISSCSTIKYAAANKTSGDRSSTRVASSSERTTSANPDYPVIQPDTPLSEDNLAGVWRMMYLDIDRRRFLSGIYERDSKEDFSIRLENTGDNEYTRITSTPTGELRGMSRLHVSPGGTRYVEMISEGRKSGTKWAIVNTANGVDVIESDENFQIRFRNTSAAKSGGFEGQDFYEFCGRTVAPLAEAANKELAVLKTFEDTYAQARQQYTDQSAARFGLFASTDFKEIFGKTFLDFDKQESLELIERLKACSIYYPNRRIAKPIAQGLYRELTNVDVLKETGSHPRGRSQISPAVSTIESGVRTQLGKIKVARQSLTTGLAKINDSTDERMALEQRKSVALTFAGDLPPTMMEAGLRDIGNAVEKQRTADIASKERSLDEKGVSYPESRLVYDATQQYLVANCSRAKLAIQASEKGGGLVQVLSARTVKQSGNYCQIISPTHIFSFNLRSIDRLTCSDNKSASCKFVANWGCRYELNPDFGFSASTKNIDPVCPLVSRSPTIMMGEYNRDGMRSWSARNVDW